jgi:hypothetical protein
MRASGRPLGPNKSTQRTAETEFRYARGIAAALKLTWTALLNLG